MNDIEKIEYASFWRRLGAYMIDDLIVEPLQKLIFFAACYVFNPSVLIFLFIINTVMFFLYRPVCHVKWGKTIGKRCLRLSVVLHNNKAVPWSRALLRELFFVPKILFNVIVVILALQHSPEIGSYAGFKNVMALFYQEQASLYLQVFIVYSFLVTAMQACLVVLHPQHRALHDLVAGTVVVRERKPLKQSKVPSEDILCLKCSALVSKEESKCLECGWTYQKEE